MEERFLIDHIGKDLSVIKRHSKIIERNGRACDIRIVKKLRIKKGSDSESLKCSVEIR